MFEKAGGSVSRRYSTRLLVYVAGITVLAAALLSWSWSVQQVQLSLRLALLAVATLVLLAMPVELPRGGNVSIAHPLLVAVLVLYGPTALAATIWLTSILSDFRSRQPAVKIIFNSAQLSISSLVAGWFFTVTVERLGLGRLVDAPGLTLYPAILVPVGIFAVTFFMLNSTLVGLVISLSQETKFLRVWLSNFSWSLLPELALALLGLALAHVVLAGGVVGLLAFVVPLLVSRGVFQSYVELREAYSDTVRGLVRAIEAKDTYTRGHSERVAQYSVSIAQALHMSTVEVEQLELAALLHDLGKIGIMGNVLRKPGRLSHEEYEIVRRHPEIAAEIISSVPFLQGAMPAIVHHHERYDGKGYAGELSGTEIPQHARILSVADCFDAMTSERSYRQTRSTAEALEELQRGRGTQFDPEIVDVFLTQVVPTLDIAAIPGPVVEVAGS